MGLRMYVHGLFFLSLFLSSNVGAEDVFPRVYSGGVSGSDALAAPENSNEFRAAGGGLYAHAVGWNYLTEDQKNSVLANFYGQDVMAETGFGLGHANWYINQLHARGVRAKFVAINGAVANVPRTPAEWGDMVDYYRAQGVGEETRIVPIFGYQNYKSHQSLLETNKISDRPDFQQIISLSGGVVLDVPPSFYLEQQQSYKDWIVDAINWTRGNGHVAVVLASPRYSGIQFPDALEQFVNSLASVSALPNIFSVVNYSPRDPYEYDNVVGSEDVPYHALGAARLMQTQFLPAVVGRVVDKDGDGATASVEVVLGRSDADPTDFAYDFMTGTEGWATKNVSGLVVSDGVLNGTASSNDPQLFRNALFLDGALVRNVIVRSKASAAGWMQIYWGSENGSIAGSNVVSSYYGTPGQWAITLFPVGDNENWKGRRISTIRFDPISVAGANFDLDWVVLSDGDYDRDGILDSVEGFSDANQDGSPDAMDIDSDGDGVTDDREGVTGRDRLDPSDMLFGGAARRAGRAEGWVPVNINDFIAGGDVFLSGVAANGDPQLKRLGFHFSGAEATRILVRYRAPSVASVQLFWGVKGASGFEASRSSSRSYTTPGQWQTLVFDQLENAAWTGEVITALRIDPVSVAGRQFEISSISAEP